MHRGVYHVAPTHYHKSYVFCGLRMLIALVVIVLVVVVVVVQYIGKVGKVVGKPSSQVCLEKASQVCLEKVCNTSEVQLFSY